MLAYQRSVLITGGDKGIGKGIVEVLAEEGNSVIFTYKNNIDGASEIVNKYPNVHAVQCDFANETSIQNAIKNIFDLSPRVDLLVNNVGIDKDCIFLKMDFSSWSEVININLIQIFSFIKSFLPGMINCAWGRIVNVSSIGAFQNAYGKSNYAASKAGLLGLTKALALELADKGITVNAVCPGAFDTDMFERIPEKYRSTIKSNIPMKRLGDPREIGYLIQFLASDNASYITGQTIHINGGWYMG